MTARSNRLIPLLGCVLLAIVGVILWQQFTGSGRTKAGAPLTQVPSALPKTKNAADADTSDETLRQVAASNKLLREKVERVIQDNDQLREQNTRLLRGRSQPPAGTPGDAASSSSGTSLAQTPATTSGTASGRSDSTVDVFTGAIDSASGAVRGLLDKSPLNSHKEVGGTATTSGAGAASTASESSAAATVATAPEGVVRYKLMPPMGYAVESTKPAGNANSVPITRFVRTSHGSTDSGYGSYPGTSGPAGRAAQQAAAAPQVPQPQAIPYFTIPENGTLAGVTAMSSIIGRVPVDGRVTDPMQFKAIVGRDNLAANGFELPDDLAGMIVTGIAIGDMALSCSEGKVRSLTFVFNDGSIRTVSTRRNRSQSSAGSTIAGVGQDLGYISDEHGNPCIPGKFVTNAASYLTDIITAKGLGVAAKAYSEAERTVSTNALGGYTSAVTGNQNRFALGAAASGATDELTSWLLSRLKNSFDAVVTPAGQKLVIHLDQEIQLDKAANARQLVYRTQNEQISRGARHGLE